ncbi:MAG TPA: tRNA (adenosine(37)-N6)-threonylcarbamoyltransferase complex ATPase subunit type 1 TsaE [Firmicutes bacterium]|nr:tRNA (adenosine(37)-N6)-threonylcarbamoyltransferase complex ATPase subunit type 1 TsaE [Bacillota bacterium]
MTYAPGETRELGELLGRLLKAGDVICLMGGLGSGKTCFAQGIGRGLGVKEPVTSPTFTIIHEYRGTGVPFYHIDVYRLEDSGEIECIGYDDYVYGEGATVIEWADKIQDILPCERLDVFLDAVEANEDGLAGAGDARRIRFVPRGARFRILVEELVRDARARL